MTDQPTNLDLQETIRKQGEEIRTISARFDALEKSIEQIMQFLKNVDAGFGLIRFSWNNIGKLGSLLIFIAGIFIFFKVGIAGVVAFFFKNSL